MLPENRISLGLIYHNHDATLVHDGRDSRTNRLSSALAAHMRRYDAFDGMNGFARMQACRKALQALDRRGWDRSYHQKVFHDQYIRACARIFFKHDGPGAFDRAHQKILELNGWDSLPQEVLISTPSQKLLRNIVKFLETIYMELDIAPNKVLRLNQEEVHIKGTEGAHDVRVVNSYPSKVWILLIMYTTYTTLQP
eukprot:3937739-Rhodomonas_salina.2